jgi:hypothetical protein
VSIHVGEKRAMVRSCQSGSERSATRKETSDGRELPPGSVAPNSAETLMPNNPEDYIHPPPFRATGLRPIEEVIGGFRVTF